MKVLLHGNCQTWAISQIIQHSNVEIKNVECHSTLLTKKEFDCEIKSDQVRNIKLLCRIDTVKELDYYKQGGILQYVLNSIIKKAS